jgi:hypothetical protein
VKTQQPVRHDGRNRIDAEIDRLERRIGQQTDAGHQRGEEGQGDRELDHIRGDGNRECPETSTRRQCWDQDRPRMMTLSRNRIDPDRDSPGVLRLR